MEPKPAQNKAADDEPPPFLESWPRVYAAVLLYILILIVALYGVTKYFSH
jgi:hypothetical protein